MIAFFLIIAFIAGVLTAASLDDGATKRAEGRAAMYRKDAALARYERAVAVEQLEHARAEIQWRGGAQ